MAFQMMVFPLLQSEDGNEQLSLLSDLIEGVIILHNIILLAVLVFAHVFSQQPSTARPAFQPQLSVFTLAVIVIASVSYLLIPWFTTFNGHGWNVPLSQSSCKWLIVLSKLSYMYPTMGVYVFFLERLFYVFRAKSYAFNDSGKKSLRLALVGITILGTALLIYGIYDDDDAYSYIEEENNCIPRHPVQEIVFFLFINILICSAIICMYCRRLFIFYSQLTTRLFNRAPMDPSSDTEDELGSKIILRSTVLIFVSMMVSSLLSICGMTIGLPSMWAALDSAVNAWCIVLMCNPFKDCFDLYCYCCCICDRFLLIKLINCYSCRYVDRCLCPLNAAIDELTAPETEMTERNSIEQNVSPEMTINVSPETGAGAEAPTRTLLSPV